jgi:uncharacterized membrane protein YdjX (TVP38/TMEM64 family)
MRPAITCGLLLALLVGSYLAWGERFEELLAGEAARSRLDSFGPWTPAAAILLMVSDVVLPIPTTAVIAALGMLYGPWVGGLIGAAGSFLAGAAGYGLCRVLGERAARFLLGSAAFERARGFFGTAGGWLVALSRWMIILPEMVSCLAGLARMPAGRYFAALACGSMPLGFAYGAIGAYGNQRPLLALAASAAVPVLLWAGVQWVLSRRSAVQQNKALDLGRDRPL